MGYSVFFDYNKTTYRLPVNPEQIEVTSSLAIETYEVLKLGQIAVPSHAELKKYSFECEFPTAKMAGIAIGAVFALGVSMQEYAGIPHYAETVKGFKGADFYLNAFEAWRVKKEPVRFIASNGISDDINTLVLLEELTITEKAGEEGDKYVAFTLREYKEYGKQAAKINVITGRKQTAVKSSGTNPKSTGYYVVKSGDSLWSIAKKYYGDGTKYKKILDANKDIIKNPSVIKIGQKLVIP